MLPVAAPERMVKVGETIALDHHDTREVLPEDMSSVQATIHCMLSLEQLSTLVQSKTKRCEGYYSVAFDGYNEYIDMDNFHRIVRNTHNPKMSAVQQCKVCISQSISFPI
jgi:hypothetical protein